MSRHIFHFSLGAGILFVLCTFVLGIFGLGMAYVLSDSRETVTVEIRDLPKGELGPISRDILSRKMSTGEMDAAYGKLDVNALAETKEGWLRDRIRARRQQSCQNQYVQSQSQRTSQRVVYYSRRVSSPVTYTNQGPCVPCSPVSQDPLPSPIPTNPMAPVTPNDIVPSIPSVPTPDIQAAPLPDGIVPSCIDGQCPR